VHATFVEHIGGQTSGHIAPQVVFNSAMAQIIEKSMQALVAWLSQRSFRTLFALGGVLGWLAWLLSPSVRRTVSHNAGLAGISTSQRRQSVAEAGRLFAEIPKLWLRPANEPLGKLVRWEGAELIETRLGHPGGLLLLTPHMGSFEMAGQAIAERFGKQQPMTVLYRPARQAWLRQLEETARARPGMATAPANLAGVRQMIHALRRGETVGLLPDQVPPEGQGVWAPFFGQPAYTMTLAARLAQQTGAQVLLLWCERQSASASYVVRVSELAKALPSQADTEAALQLAAATAINQSMEALIQQNPGQYLWAYKRYKTPRGPAGSHV
jgi:Kdo2-lipid IVA lauroyltransferase/acyltransferase